MAKKNEYFNHNNGLDNRNYFIILYGGQTPGRGMENVKTERVIIKCLLEERSKNYNRFEEIRKIEKF